MRERWFDRLGGRKFLLATLAILGGLVLGLLGKLTPEFATIASLSVGAFNLANATTTKAALSAGKDVDP